jgi:hypothetical protein
MPGKKARARASKAKKKGEAAGPPPFPPPPPPPAPAHHHPHRSKAEVEREEAEFDERRRKGEAELAEEVAELAGTHDLVDRERVVKERLDSAALRARGVEGGPYYGAAVRACAEMERLWEVTARAATAAVTTAATAAAAATGAKTPSALTEASAVAATAGRAAVAAVAAAKAAEAGESASCDVLEGVARAARGLKPRQTAAGASGSGSGSGGGGGGGGGTPTTAEPAAATRVTPSPQAATTKERTSTARAAAAADEVAKTEGATAAATYAPDRDTLVKKLHTFATSAMSVVTHDIISWIVSEFSGDFAVLVAAAAEGGDAKAQLAMWFATNISFEEKRDWLQRAMGQDYPDAFLYSGLMFVEDACGQNDEVVLEMRKEKAMRDLQMPAASGSAAAQHATGMLLYNFDCDSGSKADFLDATRWICKAARQGLDVVWVYKLNAADP